MLKNINEMKYQSGREAVYYLTSQLEGLSAELYTQLVCEIRVILSFVNRGIPFFVQRCPNALQNFTWRIDQKEPNKKTNFEDAFEKFSPALLQTISLDEPCPALSWCDYRPMAEYIYSEGEIPEYLVEKFPHLKTERALNIQKIVRKDIRFVDSKEYAGVQIADLLASGLRRLFKLKFQNNKLAALLFGRLMIQNNQNTPPIELITFGQEGEVDSNISELVRIMIDSCKTMILKC